MGLFGKTPGELNERDLRLAQALADVATIAMVQDRVASDRDAVNGRCRPRCTPGSCSSRPRAGSPIKGRLDMDQAHAALVRYSRDFNIKIGMVARAVVKRALPSTVVLEQSLHRRGAHLRASTRSPRPGYSGRVSEPGEPTEQAAAGDDGLVVPSSPRSVALTRRYVIDACVAYGWSDSSDTVALLTSELVSSSILHAYGPQVRVRVLDRGLRLRVEVFDRSPVLLVPRNAPADAVNGRGIALVDALALAWGLDVHPDGKTMWFAVGV